jgi:hypothetical protein
MSRVVVPWKPFSENAVTAASSSRARVASAREGVVVISFLRGLTEFGLAVHSYATR